MQEDAFPRVDVMPDPLGLGLTEVMKCTFYDPASHTSLWSFSGNRKRDRESGKQRD